LSEYDKDAFNNQMMAGHVHGPGTIANIEAYKIIHDQALRQKTSDAPWDYGNPTAKSPQPLLDALKTTNIGINRGNVLCVNTDFNKNNYTDIFFFVTEAQSNYLCNNASCIE
jgi:hypothetical protein